MFYYDNILIDYDDFGTGDVLVFLHGWGGDKFSLKPVYEKLSQKYRIITISFPTKLYKPWTVKKYTDMVNNLVGNLSINKYTIIGHSFGGRVAIELGNKAQRIVLIDSAGLKPKSSINKKFAIIRYKIAKRLVKLKLRKENSLAKYGSAEYRNLDPIMKKTFVNIVNYNQNKLLYDIIAPTLIIWGKSDRDTPLYMAKTLNKTIKNSTMVLLEGDHFAYLQHPERIARLIDDFVD